MPSGPPHSLRPLSRAGTLVFALTLVLAAAKAAPPATQRPVAAAEPHAGSERPAAAALTLAPDVVDFEPDPDSGRFPDGSIPVDEMPIGEQFADSHGIHFGIVVAGDAAADDEQPLLEQAGENPPDAFRYGYAGPLDQAAPGYEEQLGDWLLKADLKDGSRSLLITYDHPVEAAAGQIWDIDGTPSLGYEQWRVEALDRDGQVLDTHDSPAGHGLALDGKPWNFAVRSAPPGRIKAVRVRFIGQKSIVGLAFDRFTPSEPGPTPSPTLSPSPVPTATPLHTPTATPTATATATPTSAPSATAVPSATPSTPPTASPSPTVTPPRPTPTATPQPEPAFLYLPLTLRETDKPRTVHADVVLVLDASSSMAGAKLAEAKEAATAFARALALPDDRLAVVTFDAQARVAIDLSADEAALARAVAGITWRAGTRIDRGLEAAFEILARARRQGSPRRPFVVLLSDGRQPAGADAALVTAARLRAGGVTLHAIGYGDTHDAAHLRALAGDPARYHVAAQGGALRTVLLGLHELVACTPRDYWGRRCGRR